MATVIKVSTRRKLKIDPRARKYLRLCISRSRKAEIGIRSMQTGTELILPRQDIDLLIGALKSLPER